ncbi:MAG: Maf family protein [Candidatus Ornithomonoglobus sp.]
MSEIILASASPRRRELLANMGLDFSVVVSEADEASVDRDVPPGIYVQELALLKAASTAQKVIDRKNAIVISADTVVVNNGKILGKPADAADAESMLRELSGKTHQVFTGFCVLRLSDAYTVCKAVCTDVTFKELSEEKIKRYINSQEPMDKAGAYGIQGLGAMLVDRINGDYFNVVGLPVSALSDILEKDFEFKLM